MTHHASGGLKLPCPYCGHGRSKVTDARRSDIRGTFTRRRQCVSCQKRYTTDERVIGRYAKNPD
jgi:transcriptional regulator NrdR family protein